MRSMGYRRQIEGACQSACRVDLRRRADRADICCVNGEEMRHTYPGQKPLLHAVVNLMPGHRHSPVAVRGPGAGPPPGLPPWPLSPCLQRDWPQAGPRPEQALAPRCARPRPGPVGQGCAGCAAAVRREPAASCRLSRYRASRLGRAKWTTPRLRAASGP